MKLKFRKAKLFNSDDLKKRWYIEYNIADEKTKKFHISTNKKTLLMKRWVLVFIFFLFVSHAPMAQQTLIETASPISLIEVDRHSNIYIVCQTELKKYSSNGKLLSQYSNKLFGNIASIDVNNVLQILVFFKESNTLVFLDKELTEMGKPLPIDKFLDTEASLVCSAAENGFWIFDELSVRLLYSNKNGLRKKKSENLTAYLKAEKVLFLSEEFNQVVLQTETQLLHFDTFANLLKISKLTAKNKIYVTPTHYLFFSFPNLKIVNKQTSVSHEIKLSAYPEAKNAIRTKNKIIVQEKNKVILKNLKN